MSLRSVLSISADAWADDLAKVMLVVYHFTNDGDGGFAEVKMDIMFLTANGGGAGRGSRIFRIDSACFDAACSIAASRQESTSDRRMILLGGSRNIRQTSWS